MVSRTSSRNTKVHVQQPAKPGSKKTFCYSGMCSCLNSLLINKHSLAFLECSFRFLFCFVLFLKADLSLMLKYLSKFTLGFLTFRSSSTDICCVSFKLKYFWIGHMTGFQSHQGICMFDISVLLSHKHTFYFYSCLV